MLVTTVLTALILLSAEPLLAQPSAGIRKILIVHYYAQYQASIQGLDEGIGTIIRTSPPESVDFFFEYLDFARVQNAADKEMRARHLKEKYEHADISVVIAVADGALVFLRDHGLFPGVPVVALTQRRAPDNARVTEPDVVRVLDGPTAARTVELALRLHPDTQHLVVLGAQSGDDGEFERAARAQLDAFRTRLAITYLGNMPEEQLLDRVSRLPANSLLLVLQFAPRNVQANRLRADFYRRVSNKAHVPLYGLSDVDIGSGVVGGHVRDMVAAGAQVASLALRIALGETIATVPPQNTPSVPMFDERELRRWGIDRRLLPAGSIVRFHQPGFWEQYKGYVLAALALCIVQCGFIAALLVQRARRRETEARNDAILRAIPDLMFLQTKDGVYLAYHASQPDQLLTTPDRFLGRNMREVLPPELLRTLEPRFRRAVEQREPVLVEYDLKMPDAVHHYEARMVPCSGDQVLSVVRDITERKRSEAALRQSQQRYALATAAGGVGAWDWNLETNEVYVDPSLKAVLGFEDSEIRNHLDDWEGRIHPDDAPSVMALAQAHIKGETPVYEVEHRMLHKDGSIRWFLARGSVVKRKDGTPVRVIGTGTDVTERKASEQALLETQGELTRMSRLAALGEFAASIAHEVRQPLTAILMNANTSLRWLRSTSPNISEIGAALSDIVDAGKRADEVILRNRELFRHHTVEKVPLDINAIILEVAVLARTRLQNSRVTLDTTLAIGVPPVMGDRVELQQVLLNLILNGIDAMDPIDPSSRQLTIISAIVPDAGVRVSVRDAGVGLAGVDLQRMFTTSYTTKPTGSGIGLSISRLIVEAHGGRIWAEQNDDSGATVSFTIPCVESVVTA
jgi:PAS domain S-box-containing protein